MGWNTRSDRRALWVLGVVSLLLQLPFLERGFSPLDEGSMLAIAEALGHGEVLYRDKATFIGPLMYELMSVLLTLFGSHLLVGRLFQVLAFGATVVVSYGILRSFVPLRWAMAAALALLVLKPLALPLWTIPSYNQLGMLFALVAALATLRHLDRHGTGALVTAGVAIGLTVVTKLSLGAGIALAVAAAVALDAARGAGAPLRGLIRRIGILAATALVPVAITLVWYAAHGALGAFADRTLLGLGGVSTDMRVPLPSPLPWNAQGADLFRLQHRYFPPPLLRDVKLLRSQAGPMIEAAVKLAYYGPLLATALAFVACFRELRDASRLRAACGWLLVASFSALAYASTAHRLDFAHILIIAPAPLLACTIVLHRWLGKGRLRAIPVAVLLAWVAAGALASRVVFDTYDTPLATPRGRVVASAEEVADAEVLLGFLEKQPRDARILLLRTIPIFYFLADRPIIGTFDLYLPGYFREGEDARTAREIAAVDLVVYNPNDLIGIPKPITEFAPLSARALADGFEITRILSPTAVVLEPRAPGPPRVTVADIARHPERIETRAPEGRVETASWMMYPVVTTIVAKEDRATCFTYRHDARMGDVLTVRPMFKHVAWTNRFWPDAARRIRLSVDVRAGGRREVIFREERRAGLPGAPVEVGLDAYAGREVALRFCARRLQADRVAQRKATVGWADPRIVRPAAAP
jgi:hypothetical protein